MAGRGFKRHVTLEEPGQLCAVILKNITTKPFLHGTQTLTASQYELEAAVVEYGSEFPQLTTTVRASLVHPRLEEEQCLLGVLYQMADLHRDNAHMAKRINRRTENAFDLSSQVKSITALGITSRAANRATVAACAMVNQACFTEGTELIFGAPQLVAAPQSLQPNKNNTAS